MKKVKVVADVVKDPKAKCFINLSAISFVKSDVFKTNIVIVSRYSVAIVCCIQGLYGSGVNDN